MRLLAPCTALSATILTVSLLAAQVVRPQPIRGDGRSGPPVTLREVMRIGSESGANDAFGQITDVALDRRGRVYVADAQTRRVTVFNADGSFRAAVGRRGNGPGEMQTPWKVAVDAHDSLFVYDLNNARISVFDPQLRFRRDFRIPPNWLVNSLGFLPDGRLLVAAYGRGEAAPLHVLARDGRRLSSFGPRPQGRDLEPFESSLLGGAAAVSADGIAYSNKSPYEISFFDLSGRLQARCTGRPQWTTPPAQAISRTDQGSGLDFGRYVHSANIVPLSGGTFLNVVHDPVNGRQVLDVIGRDCTLRRRTVLDVPLAITAHAGSRIAAVQTIDYPEVVIYTITARR